MLTYSLSHPVSSSFPFAHLSRKACSTLGRRGFEATTNLYFAGREDYHKNWLRIHAQAVYAECAGRPGSIGGKFPPRVLHPSKLSNYARWVIYLISTGKGGTVSFYEDMLTDDELLSVQAVTEGRVYGRLPF